MQSNQSRINVGVDLRPKRVYPESAQADYICPPEWDLGLLKPENADFLSLGDVSMFG